MNQQENIDTRTSCCQDKRNAACSCGSRTTSAAPQNRECCCGQDCRCGDSCACPNTCGCD